MMDERSFDRVAHAVAGGSNRRGFLRGLAAGAAVLLGASKGGSVAAATRPTLTIHNAVCAKKLDGEELYAACYKNGFGCVDFFFRSRRLRTNAKGRATATVAAGTLTLRQQQSRVTRSSGIYVYCSDSLTQRVIYDGRADAGSVNIALRTGEKVICDWYNYSTKDLRLPQQCPQPTTTTTTTTLPPKVCNPTKVCTSDSDCSAIPNTKCISTHGVSACICDHGYRWSVDERACMANARVGSGLGICEMSLNLSVTDSVCTHQMCSANCPASASGLGVCSEDQSGFYWKCSGEHNPAMP